MNRQLLDELEELLQDDPEAAKRLRRLLPAAKPKTRLAPLALTAVFVCVVTAGTVAAAPGVDELFVFGAGTPARASEVNANFGLLQQWTEEKGGPVCNGAPCNVSVSGSQAIAGTQTVGGSQTVAGNVRVSSTGQNSAFSVANIRFETDIPPEDIFIGGVATPLFGRIHADSFHTNGLGANQLYLEGSAIDAVGSILIGTGVAGGASTSTQAVQMGNDLRVAGAIQVGGDTTLSGHLDIADIDQNSGGHGCMRIGDMQICNGTTTIATNTALTFRRRFSTGTYAVTANCISGTANRFITISSRVGSNARANCRSSSGSSASCLASWIAIGPSALSAW